MHLWAGVMGILYREYHAEYAKDALLETSTLGLFARIDRVGSSYNGTASQRGYDEILREWDDMVDADSISYALIGKRMTLEINEPVIVVTGDQKEDVDRRLECLYKNLQEMKAKGLATVICPGTIILFSLETMECSGKLDVQDFINKLDSIEEPSLVATSEPQKSGNAELK